MRSIDAAIRMGIALAIVAAAACGGGTSSPSASAATADVTLLNVSYDPTRELHRLQRRVRQARGQARAVIDGLDADVVTHRPRDNRVAAKHADVFADAKLFTIDEGFGRWEHAQTAHFADQGTFDQIYRPDGR